jgi:hypothetical protein
MKNFLSAILLFCGLSMLMTACKKDEVRAVTTGGQANVLSASSTTITLTKAQAADTVVKFSWTPTNFGYKAAVTYTLQLDVKGDNFASPKEVTINAGSLGKSYTGLDFNALLLSMSLPTGTNTAIEARVKADIGSSQTPVYSNVLSLTVNPYALVSYVYVPGAYQGWNPATADSLKSATSNGIYTGVITFTPGNLEFKITPQKKWDVAYGDAGSGTISTSGGNLKAPAAGAYQITVNLNDNTIKMDPVQWSIIGDGTPGGWGADTDMQFNNGTQTWNVTVPLTAAYLKFRKNHDWGTNFGGSGGVLAPGGANIPIPSAGTYIVTLDLNAGTYNLAKQ